MMLSDVHHNAHQYTNDMCILQKLDRWIEARAEYIAYVNKDGISSRLLSCSGAGCPLAACDIVRRPPRRGPLMQNLSAVHLRKLPPVERYVANV